MKSIFGKGYSLPELLVTFAVAAILIALAVPNMKVILAERRVAAITELLYKSIVLARSEAVTRSEPVSLCRGTGVNQCAVDGENWVTGWLVFTDKNSDAEISADDQRIRVQQALSSSVSIVWNRGRSLRFDSRGQARDAGAFTVCEQMTNSMAARTITISLTGRARVEVKGSCAEVAG